MKRILVLLVVLCSLLVVCNDSDSDVQINTTISPINSEEFNGLGGTNKYGESTEKDFKKLTFDFSIEHKEEINRDIKMFNDWRTFLNEYDEVNRYWGGNSSFQDNMGVNFAQYDYELIFYAKGLSEEDIKEIFEEARIYVTWEVDEETKTSEYSIRDSIKFEE